MYDLIEMTKTNKMQNLVLSFLIMIFCFVNLILNLNNYKSVFTNNYKIVNSIKELEEAKDKKDQFIYIDMKEAKLENYALESDNRLNTYTVKLKGSKVMVLLKEDTLLTSKVPVEIIKDNDNTTDLRNKIETKYDTSIILSDMNYTEDRQVCMYKAYILLTVLILSIISVFINLFGVIKPEKTLRYKIYSKKYYY